RRHRRALATPANRHTPAQENSNLAASVPPVYSGFAFSGPARSNGACRQSPHSSASRGSHQRSSHSRSSHSHLGLSPPCPPGARGLPPSSAQSARRERGSKSPYAFTTTFDCHRARAAYFDDRPAVRKDGGLLWKV